MIGPRCCVIMTRFYNWMRFLSSFFALVSLREGSGDDALATIAGF